MSENSYLRHFQCTSITNRVLTLFDRLTPYYNCMTYWNVQKTHIFAISVHKYQKSCSYFIWSFDALLKLYELKCQKTHISAISVHKYHKSLFLSYLTVLRLKTTGLTWNVRKLIFPLFQCISITNLVLSLFDCFTILLQLYELRIVIKLIYPPFQCTSITNRVLTFIWSFYALLTTVWTEMSENSYIRHFSAQVSQIVFLSYLTVLRT